MIDDDRLHDAPGPLDVKKQICSIRYFQYLLTLMNTSMIRANM
jgi:hypothetical protein